MLPQVVAVLHRLCQCTAWPDGAHASDVKTPFRKDPGSLFWWLAEDRGAFPKADGVTGLRLCFCCGTITSYLPGGVLYSSPCNCDFSVKTRPLSPWQIEAQRPDSLGYTPVASGSEACGLMWPQCLCWSSGWVFISFTGSSRIL